MKYAISGDFLGESFGGLEKVLDFYRPDCFIFLGNLDSLDTIHELKDFEEKHSEEGFIKVPGNHDYAAFYNQHIVSGNLARKNINLNVLHDDLMEDKDACEYMERFVDNHVKKLNLDWENFGNMYSTIVTHGGYEGSMNGTSNEDMANLWVRLKSTEDHWKNFNAMRPYNVMLKGHDKAPSYTYNDPKKGIVTYPVEGNKEYRLFPERQHTISPGRAHEGRFAIIDTNKEEYPIIKFRKC